MSLRTKVLAKDETAVEAVEVMNTLEHECTGDEHCPHCFDVGFEQGAEYARSEANDAIDAAVAAASESSEPVARGRGRKSGKGSRLRKYECACEQIVRAATDELDATCNKCGTPFQLAAPTIKE